MRRALQSLRIPKVNGLLKGRRMCQGISVGYDAEVFRLSSGMTRWPHYAYKQGWSPRAEGLCCISRHKHQGLGRIHLHLWSKKCGSILLPMSSFRRRVFLLKHSRFSFTVFIEKRTCSTVECCLSLCFLTVLVSGEDAGPTL